jgi:L-lactate dehydrogenase complex protein LldF
MGSVLTPALAGIERTANLPNASTFCGKCESVCPVKIPLPKMMRHWREREFERHLTPPSQRRNLALWRYVARRPALYRAATRAAVAALGLVGRGRGAVRSLPLAGGWTEGRDLPLPEGRGAGGTFMAAYAKQRRQNGRAR